MSRQIDLIRQALKDLDDGLLDGEEDALDRIREIVGGGLVPVERRYIGPQDDA